MDYQKHIASAAWQKTRERILARDNYRCRTCFRHKDDFRLEVHHATYDRFGNEDDNDLITLCVRCHDAITSALRQERYERRDVAVIEETVTITRRYKDVSENQGTVDGRSAVDSAQQRDSRSDERTYTRYQGYFRETEES